MPRYEFKEGTSNKFWEVSLDGDTFTTRYGKIGTDGQETSKSFKTAAEAKKQYDKIVAEKVKKGYQLVDGDGDDDDMDDDDDE
jgi:predicted DNA-binding WGR domain protein